MNFSVASIVAMTLVGLVAIGLIILMLRPIL